jgi:prepilin-type N-terminal cleavage/methylation domain-containing protein
MNGPRRGFTVAECVVALALAGVIAGLLQQLCTFSTHSSNLTVAVEDAHRSMLVAAESIGADLRRALVDSKKPDLQIGDDGRTISFSMAATFFTNWEAPRNIICYALSERSGSRKRLVRTDGNGSRILRGCWLRDIHFRLCPPFPSGPWRQGVLLTLVAPVTERDSRTMTVEIPVSLSVPPPSYLWVGPEGSQS